MMFIKLSDWLRLFQYARSCSKSPYSRISSSLSSVFDSELLSWDHNSDTHLDQFRWIGKKVKHIEPILVTGKLCIECCAFWIYILSTTKNYFLPQKPVCGKKPIWYSALVAPLNTCTDTLKRVTATKLQGAVPHAPDLSRHCPSMTIAVTQACLIIEIDLSIFSSSTSSNNLLAPILSSTGTRYIRCRSFPA